MNEKKLLKIANLIHGEVCGCDNKYCAMPTEIYDWLYNGDAKNLKVSDVPDLVSEWKEYAGQVEEE